MAVMAPVSDFSLAALARFSAGLPLPEGASLSKQQGIAGVIAVPPPALQPGPGQPAPVPDVVVFSSAPMRVLSDLASAGLRQLTALLPILEQAVQTENVAPLGAIAKAVATAARQIADGHPALLAEGPDRVAAALRGETVPRSLSPASAAPDTKQLLRTLARQIGADTEPSQEGHPSETLRAIARQIGASDQIELRAASDPGDGPIQRWLGEAKHVLRSAGDTLERAEQQLRPLAAEETPRLANGLLGATTPPGSMPAGWVLTEILAAQAQIALAYAALGQARATVRFANRAMPRTFSFDNLAGATTIVGTLVMLALLWIAGGLWSLATGIVGFAATSVWVLRINRASRGVMLDARG